MDCALTTSIPRRGLSLVEVVMVMAITVIVAMIALPRYAQSIARYRADMAARRVAADLALAQSTARAASTARTVQFDATTSTYQLLGISDITRSTVDTQVRLTNEPFRTSIVSADFGGSPNITFNGFGAPSSAGSVVIKAGSV